MSTVDGPDPETLIGMRNNRFVQVVVWVVIIGMVLALVVAAISLS